MKDKMINVFKNIVNDKKKLFLVLGIVIILTVIIVFIFTFGNDILIGVTRNPDGERIKKEYVKLNGVEDDNGKLYPEVNIPSYNILKYINVNEILRLFENDGDAVIFFGYPKNLYSRSVIEVLCNSALSTDLDVIYYLDIEKEFDGYDDLVKILGDKFLNDENKIYAPLVIFVVDGSIVSHNKGTLFSHEDPYMELDKYQIEGLSEIYKYGIRDVLNAKKYN